MSELSLPGYGASQSVGIGCAGELYRCRHDDGTERAVRKLNALAIDRERLRRQFQLQSKLPVHEGVARLLDFQVDGSPYFVAYPWIDQAVPFGLVERPDDESEAWARLLSIAEAVAHLHRHGVHHGNLHPGNVLAGPEGESPIIVDAGPGLGGRVHHLEVGETAWYAPPEQLENPVSWEDGTAERWDVYRFGVIAFEWLNGRMPRGEGYRQARERAIAESGGRPVEVDPVALAEDLRQSLPYAWREDEIPSRENRLRRAIIDRCLALDPSERPVDLREVVADFEALEVQFERERAEQRIRATIEDAEARVQAERKRQARILFQTRLTAAVLLASLIATAVFLVRFRQRSHGFEDRAAELDLVVHHQRSQLEEFDRRWSQTQHELRTTREAADSVFSQVGQADLATATEGVPAEGSIEFENLEKSRTFFLDAIEEAAGDSARQLERVRNLQNLAHVELRLGRKEEAKVRLESTIPLFEALLSERGEEVSVVRDLESRLADCHETLARLIEHDPSEEMRHALGEASRYLARLAEGRPDDEQLVRRRLSVDFRLARQDHEHRRFEEALERYVSLGERLDAMATADPDSISLQEMIGEVQFHTALTLRAQGRGREAVEAYLAALETVSRLGEGRAHDDEQCLRLARIYADLGDLFAEGGETTPEEIEEVYTEALRLVSPVAFRRPNHLETALLFALTTNRIGSIERDSGRWTDGYRSSAAGIEKLEAALASDPGNLEGRLTLVELRAGHTELLKYQKSVARKCLGKGLEMAQTIDEDLNAPKPTLPVGVREGVRIRLATAYEAYGVLCREFGDEEQAATCFERALQARELLVQRADAVDGEQTVAF